MFSKTRNQYYVGSTCKTVDERLNDHNTNPGGYTGKIGDWAIVLSEEFPTRSDAVKRERQIKAWKSRKKIEELITESSGPN